MRKALVFISAFALVLVAGVAVAFMTTPGNDAAADKPEAIEEPTDTSTTFHEKEEPQQEEPIEEPKDEENHEEEPPKTEEPKEEEHDEEPPKEEEDTDPPDLIITFPENGQHFEESRIAFEGKTEPGARVFAGEYEADVNDDGQWRIILILSPGGNLATFKAIDEAGNKSTASVKAYYDAPEEEKDPPKDFEFWAEQKYGSCGESPAYDKWYGMGEPGTKIEISSDYGSGQTTIGESGEWYLKVIFYEAPCNEAFVVTLTTDGGHEKHYEFIRLCEEDGGGHDGK